MRPSPEMIALDYEVRRYNKRHRLNDIEWLIRYEKEQKLAGKMPWENFRFDIKVNIRGVDRRVTGCARFDFLDGEWKLSHLYEEGFSSETTIDGITMDHLHGCDVALSLQDGRKPSMKAEVLGIIRETVIPLWLESEQCRTATVDGVKPYC